MVATWSLDAERAYHMTDDRRLLMHREVPELTLRRGMHMRISSRAPLGSFAAFAASIGCHTYQVS